MKPHILFLLFACIGIHASEPENHLKRIHAHLIVKDALSACQEAQMALSNDPNNLLLLEAYIKALAHAGKEKEMWNVWQSYASLFPEQALTNQDLHETMAWGIIWKGADSSLPMIRLCSLLAAFFSNDANGTALLQRFCHDQSSLLRSAAIQLISHMQDAQLRDEILTLLTSETNWKARLETIKAIGKMKIKEGQRSLLDIIANDENSAEEKAVAITALMTLFDTIDRQKMEELANSPRAGLRHLACKIVSHLRSERDIDLMLLLASDNHAEVRAAALHTLGLLKPSNHPSILSLAQTKLQDPSPTVAITAAWLLTILDSTRKQEAFMPMMTHPQREVRLLASAAVGATGKYGLPLTLELFSKSRDPFVKMNLAIGLIYQQTDTGSACKALESGLAQEMGRWMWKEEGPFRVLAPSTIKQDEEIPNFPEALNQLTRLEILNMLAVMKHPGAETAILGFLSQRKWGIAGLASAVLLMEGDEVSLKIVENLLKDRDPRIRMEAALTLSLWGGKEEAIATLENGYATADRETKEKILEGLGKIGSRHSIPFLLNTLQEPQQILRIIAASSLLQCLYH